AVAVATGFMDWRALLDNFRRGLGFGHERLDDRARGVAAVADGGVEVFEAGDAVVLGYRLQLFRTQQLHRNLEPADLALKQLLTQLLGAFAAVGIEPLLDLVAGAGSLSEREPVCVGLAAFLRDDLNHLAVAET